VYGSCSLAPVSVTAQWTCFSGQKIERLRFSDVTGVGKTLSTDEDIEELVEQLRDRLRKLIAAGVKIVLE
jgi:hypothetical protein